MKKGFLYAFALCGALLASCSGTQETKEKAFLPPLMGWSSWNTYFVDISEDLIKKQADAMVSTGLKDAGYKYINIDDGFFGYRDSVGKMTYNAERFPNGMRVVCREDRYRRRFLWTRPTGCRCLLQRVEFRLYKD